MGTAQGLVRGSAPRLALTRALVATVAVAVLSGCFELKIDAAVRPSGNLAGQARLVVPLTLLRDRDLGPILGGSGGSPQQTWRRAGMWLEPRGDDRYSVDMRGPVTAMTLPWLRFGWARPAADRFAYRHELALPAAVLERLEQQVDRVLAPLGEHLPNRGGPIGESALGQGARRASVEIELTFPGEVTASDGERIDARTVRWVVPAEALRSGERRRGFAAGRIGWSARLLGAALDAWDTL